jgi:cell division protein FtsZ
MNILFPNDSNDASQSPAVIKVIGVGGGGSNAVNRMIEANVSGVEFIAINTDAQVLRNSAAPVRVQIGEKLSRGLGVGGNPVMGQKSAEESIDVIRELIKGAHMVFITAGMGGGTGTGAAPVVAQIARAENVLSIGVVTKPFKLEGVPRMEQAEEGIKNLRNYTDALIVIPNQKVFDEGWSDERMPWPALYRIIDDVLRQSVQAISDVITKPGEINRDFADINTIMKNAGTALIGIGEAAPENVEEAINKAITSPFLDNQNITLAQKLLINITTSPQAQAANFRRISEIIEDLGVSKAHIFLGHTYDNTLDNKIRVTMIATGFKDAPPEEEKKEERSQIQGGLFDNMAETFGRPASSKDYSQPAYIRHKVKKLK